MANHFMTKTINHEVDEVKFKMHINEFERFYQNHKSFCDEVGGIKARSMVEGNEIVELKIGKENFIYAIRRLQSFVIDNLHYIKSIDDVRKLEGEVEGLEEEYIHDEVYHHLLKKTRTASEEIILNKKYLEYVIRIYETGNKLFNLLQNSLMIATSKVKKDVEYRNETSFFYELGRYRTEVSDSISNYKFSDTFIVLKKILGYHYTYKILIEKKEQKFTDQLLKLLINEILQDKTIRMMQKVASGGNLTSWERQFMKETHHDIKRTLLKVYYITNKNLSERKILPKIRRTIHIDKTLI